MLYPDQARHLNTTIVSCHTNVPARLHIGASHWTDWVWVWFQSTLVEWIRICGRAESMHAHCYPTFWRGILIDSEDDHDVSEFLPVSIIRSRSAKFWQLVRSVQSLGCFWRHTIVEMKTHKSEHSRGKGDVTGSRLTEYCDLSIQCTCTPQMMSLWYSIFQFVEDVTDIPLQQKIREKSWPSQEWQ